MRVDSRRERELKGIPFKSRKKIDAIRKDREVMTFLKERGFKHGGAAPNLPEIINQQEAAAFLGVSVKTLRKEVNAGGVPCKRIGSRYVFNRRALAEWVSGIND